MQLSLNSSLSALSGMSDKILLKFKKLGLKSVQDLLFYFPFRYEDYSNIVSISDLRLHEGETVTVNAKIEFIKNRRGWKKRKMITEAIVADESGSLRVVWFNQSYLVKALLPGDEVNLSGKVKIDMLGPQLTAPSYEKIKTQVNNKYEEKQTTHTARLVPIYSLTDGLTEKQLRFFVKQTMAVVSEIEEWIPEEIMEKYDLIGMAEAIKGVHFPEDEIDLEKSLERLKFGELFTLQLKGALAREKREREKAPVLQFKEKEIKDLVATLPFKLTDAQRQAAWDIIKDLGQSIPTNRLLSGDVGSGKTIVAALALYNTVLNFHQGVFLAPTEILAVQHFESLKKILPPGLNIAVFTRSQARLFGELGECGMAKNDLLKKIKNAEVNIIIGTHALLSNKVEFGKLGLIIVDEQHRFGVEQRKALKNKAKKEENEDVVLERIKSGVHYLSMTATPIPRSLALMLYGDLDLSTIEQMPMGRKKILTRLVEAQNRPKAYDFIKTKIKEGRQVFVICPLVNKKEKTDDNALEKKSVMGEFEKLSKNIFPDLKIACLYGKMKPEEKEKTMKNFKDGKIDILISTSVVEVGVDVPNAVIMMIEGAENFGLAQLHQFRGRVGRSSHQSYCFLFTDTENELSLSRLKYFEELDNGFKLAQIDLETRGPGEVYGIKQSGGARLKLAKLSDKKLIKWSRQSAKEVLENKNIRLKIKDRLLRLSKEVHLE